MALGSSLQVQERTQLKLQLPHQVIVPAFFLCPISLELMRDPVTLCTGMTFDRASIERWLGLGHNTCPATNQILESQELIPNHTLRRLIQNWCVANKAYGVERIPTPKAPAEPGDVKQLLEGIGQCEEVGCDSLKNLWSLAKECERNRRCIEKVGAVPILAKALAQLWVGMRYSAGCNRGREVACEEALATIALLQLDDGDRRALVAPESLECLVFLLTSGSLDAKLNAADVIHTLCEEDPHVKTAVASLPGAMKGLVNLLKDDLCPRAVQAGLRCLLCVCLPRSNRVMAIECRAISVVVELLPNTEKRTKELAFAVMEILANCAEGREAISNHALAIPMIVKSMLGVSQRVTECAVSTLWVVLSYASNRSVTNTALQAGAFANLLMLLPGECSQRAKHKARDSLRLLNENWGSYTCRPADEARIINKRDLGQLRFKTDLV